MSVKNKKNNPGVQVAITEIGALGDGTGTYSGKPVYVAKTAPGDRALVQLDGLSGDSYAGKLVAVETRGADRAEPPCPYFNECGGCALQHVTQEFYHSWKIAKVKNTLERTGVAYGTWEEPAFLPHATRRRTSLAALRTGANVTLGYNEERTHNILDIRICMILEPDLDAKIQALRPYLPRLLPDKKTCDITLQYAGGAFDMVLTGPFKFSYEQDEVIAELAEKLDIARVSHRLKDFKTPEILLSRKPVIKKSGALNVEIPPGAFLQPSAAGEKTLSDFIMQHTAGETNIADLFSGCGTFTGILAENGANVTAIDSDPHAINALTKAATPFGNITAKRRDLFRNPLTAQELAPFSCVVFDPPRAGAKEQATMLAQSGVAKIIGISCNPATFARDAKILAAGGYTLASVRLVDQFVWSAHVEIVGVFTKNE